MDTLKKSPPVPTEQQRIAVGATMLLFTLSFLGATAVSANPVPRYMAAVKQEIVRLGFPLDCSDSEGVCTITPATATGDNDARTTPPVPIHIVVDDSSSTVRIEIVSGISTDNLSAEKAKYFLTLNHRMMTAKISINEKTGALSMSAVVNTDTNFDRKTFRSVLKGFIQISSELKDDLFAQN